MKVALYLFVFIFAIMKKVVKGVTITGNTNCTQTGYYFGSTSLTCQQCTTNYAVTNNKME